MKSQIQDNLNLIARYKSDIDLVAYLSSQGFDLDRERTTKKWTVLEDSTTDRKLIVGKNAATGHYYYWNPNDSSDKGTIIELLAQFRQLDLSRKTDWDQLHKEAGDMIGNAYFTQHDHVIAQHQRPESRQEAISQYFKLDTLKNTDFLNLDRRLTNETIFAEEFVGKIFNKSFIDKTYQNAGKNTVFPIENEAGMIGIINRSPIWNQIQGSKDNGVWASNILSDKPVREMLIAEAPIDCLSYHQLNPPKQTGERLYVATAGTLTSGQPMTIQRLINLASPQQLILANDNDFQGIRFNINLMGKLLMPDQANTGITTHITNSAHTNTFTVDINTTLAAQHGFPTTIDQIKDRINLVMNRGFPAGAPKANLNVITNRDDITQIQVTFPNIRPLLIRAENLTAELRQCNEKIVIKRALENDWNLDVQMKALKTQVQTELGIKLSGKQLIELIKKDKSDIVLNKDNDPGKIILDYTKGSVNPIFIKRAENLQLPDSFMGVALSQQDKQQLLASGELNRRVEMKHPIYPETIPGYIGVDADLKQLVFLRGDRLRNQNIYQTDVTDEQIKQVVNGQPVTVNRMVKDAEGQKNKVPVELKISAAKGEISIIPISPPISQRQSIPPQSARIAPINIKTSQNNTIEQANKVKLPMHTPTKQKHKTGLKP